MKRKIVSLALAMAMVASLVACGNGVGTAESGGAESTATGNAGGETTAASSAQNYSSGSSEADSSEETSGSVVAEASGTAVDVKKIIDRGVLKVGCMSGCSNNERFG